MIVALPRCAFKVMRWLYCTCLTTRIRSISHLRRICVFKPSSRVARSYSSSLVPDIRNVQEWMTSIGLKDIAQIKREGSTDIMVPDQVLIEWSFRLCRYSFRKHRRTH